MTSWLLKMVIMMMMMGVTMMKTVGVSLGSQRARVPGMHQGPQGRLSHHHSCHHHHHLYHCHHLYQCHCHRHHLNHFLQHHLYLCDLNFVASISSILSPSNWQNSFTLKSITLEELIWFLRSPWLFYELWFMLILTSIGDSHINDWNIG